MNHCQQFSNKILLIMVSFLLLPSLTFGFQNEPTAFRGILWESNINNLSDMEYKGKSLIDAETVTYEHYLKNGDKMKIGDIALDSINYSFCNKKFCSVYIKLHSCENIFNLLESFLVYYGNPNITGEPFLELKWSGVNIDIEVTKLTDNNSISIFYIYKPLYNVWFNEVEEKMSATSNKIPPSYGSLRSPEMFKKRRDDKNKEFAKDL